jgi:major membrane immunogen (membrane-anchored lipoprotein)
MKRRLYCCKTARANFVVFLLFLFLMLAGCAKSGPRDGTYTGRSGEDDDGAYGEVTITVAGEKITACEYVTFQRDGTIKGEDYGKINGDISNQVYYDKAQLAVRAMSQYARDYLKTGKLRDVEAVTGDTISFEQFNDAVADALEKAK